MHHQNISLYYSLYVWVLQVCAFLDISNHLIHEGLLICFTTLISLLVCFIKLLCFDQNEDSIPACMYWQHILLHGVTEGCLLQCQNVAYCT